MRQIMPHRNNMSLHRNKCKLFLARCGVFWNSATILQHRVAATNSGQKNNGRKNNALQVFEVFVDGRPQTFGNG
jgi:hypothetical protein